jgi:hypothetical protein
MRIHYNNPDRCDMINDSFGSRVLLGVWVQNAAELWKNAVEERKVSSVAQEIGSMNDTMDDATYV